MELIKKIAKKLEWIFDYYIAYFLYNPRKVDLYHNYLREKWDFGPEELGISENEDIVQQPQSVYNHKKFSVFTNTNEN